MFCAFDARLNSCSVSGLECRQNAAASCSPWQFGRLYVCVGLHLGLSKSESRSRNSIEEDLSGDDSDLGGMRQCPSI